jgi:acyl dehydratase
MLAQQRWYEHFVLHERFVLPSRTMTSAIFAAFQTASGDTHPIHYDVEYCRLRGMPNLLAHGFHGGRPQHRTSDRGPNFSLIFTKLCGCR